MKLNQTPHTKPNKNRIDKNTKIALTAMLCITTAGLILRLHNLGAASVWLDESISAISAYNLIAPTTQTIPLMASEYNRSILNVSLTALSFKLFGYTELAGRIPSALFGTLTIPTAYLLGKKIKGKRFALLLAFFVAFATVQIAWSQQMRPYQQLQFFFLLALYLNERFLDKTTWKNLLLLAIPTIAMPLTDKTFGYLLITPIAAWFPIEKANWIKEKIKNHHKIKRKNILGATLLLTAIALFTITTGPSLIKSLTSTIATKIKYLNQTNYLQEYITYFNNELGFLTLLTIPGATLAIIERKRNLLYLTTLLLQLYMISYNIVFMQHRYAFTLIPLLLIFALLTIEYTIKKTQQTIQNTHKNHKHKNTLKITATSLIIITVIASATPAANLTFIPKEKYSLGPTAPQGEFKQAYTYIKQNWQPEDIIISTLTPVSWFYLQRSDYWLSCSISGIPPTLPDKDTITNSTVIKYKEDLQAVMNNTSGWIVIDLMGMSRANTETLTYITQNLNLIKEISGPNKGIWVYRWTNQQQNSTTTTTNQQTPTS